MIPIFATINTIGSLVIIGNKIGNTAKMATNAKKLFLGFSFNNYKSITLD